jgi:hypothetical protein
MMVKPNLLLEKAEDVVTAQSIGWEHGEHSSSAKKIVSATIKWPNAVYKATWSKIEKRFLLDHDNKPNFAKSGQQLGSPMMVIQIATIKPSEYGDKFGGVTPKTTVTGSGYGYLLRNGSVTRVSWERLQHNGLWRMDLQPIFRGARFGYSSLIKNRNSSIGRQNPINRRIRGNPLSK